MCLNSVSQPGLLHVVWFKRDLQLFDYAPLVGLCVYEAEYGDAGFDAAPLEFINQSFSSINLCQASRPTLPGWADSLSTAPGGCRGP